MSDADTAKGKKSVILNQYFQLAFQKIQTINLKHDAFT